MLMKSRIFLTNLEMEADPFMSLINKGDVWKLRKKNSKLLLRKQRPLLNKKKTRF